MLDIYHNEGAEMLKHGCTLPNIATFVLQKSTTETYCPFTESNKDLSEKIHEDMVVGPSIVFSREAVLEMTFIHDSTNWCKTIVGFEASQLFPFSMCQAMPNGLYTTWEPGSESDKFKQRQNKSSNFESIIMSYFQRIRPECKVECFYTTGTQKKRCIKVW